MLTSKSSWPPHLPGRLSSPSPPLYSHNSSQSLIDFLGVQKAATEQANPKVQFLSWSFLWDQLKLDPSWDPISADLPCPSLLSQTPPHSFSTSLSPFSFSSQVLLVRKQASDTSRHSCLCPAVLASYSNWFFYVTSFLRDLFTQREPFFLLIY